ncbi:hypothetical protein [Reticulibacter mediterranei]|uniref:hypothetical protein n=1 Tax=Reticulibacter mediterranei TaxID=2778369 RepID=UPI001C690198|nr:hypothetical protein [Reticulibacter mediterranei]
MPTRSGRRDRARTTSPYHSTSCRRSCSRRGHGPPSNGYTLPLRSFTSSQESDGTDGGYYLLPHEDLVIGARLVVSIYRPLRES